MIQPKGINHTATLPEGHAAIPIDATSNGQPLRLCAIARTEPTAAADSPTGPLILLRSTLDSRAYLGAILDTANQIREWLEIRVQTTTHLPATFQSNPHDLINTLLDARWADTARTCTEADPAAAIQTGFETQHPRPTYLNLDTLTPWHPADPEGHPWTLATDDAELLAHGLPAYSSTHWRYLRANSAEGPPHFTALTPGAPDPVIKNPLPQPPTTPPGARLAPFNPEGGLLFIRRLAPFSLDDYIAFLSGRPWKGNPSGRNHYILDTLHHSLGDWDIIQQGGAHLFTTLSGRAGRFIETLHLKLSTLHQAIRLVRATVKNTQLPLLNLGSDSFRVTLATPGSTLPALWTATLSLVRSGQAIALPIKTADTRYFKALEQPTASVYRPAFMGRPITGQGTVRIRHVYSDTGGRTCLEGTLVTHDRVGHSASDILWIRLPLAIGQTADLFARLDTEEGLAAGEARFRTIPQDLDTHLDQALRSTEGSVFPDTPFETIPLLSTPADLYSLGVLGTLLLTVNNDNTLGIATDDMLGYARKLAQEHQLHPDEPLATRAHRIAQSDPRIRSALGAHRLTSDQIQPEDALSWIPPGLWWRILASITRFFPGTSPDSYCKDFGDASPFNLEKAFDAPLHDIETLLAHTRSLVVTDWTTNREIARVIRRLAP